MLMIIRSEKVGQRLHDARFITAIVLYLLFVAVTILGPTVVIGFQIIYWLKNGSWLPLPLSTIGIESWHGLARIPVAAALFAVGATGCWISSFLIPKD